MARLRPRFHRVSPQRSEVGAALVELAVTLPLLVLVLVGTIDFARVFYAAIELTNAARAGAQYGAASVAKSNDDPGMQSTAIAAAPNISSVSATSTRTCECTPDSGSTFTGVLCPDTCPAGQHLVVSVTVTATRTFTTITLFPGIPGSIPLVRSATMRVSN